CPAPAFPSFLTRPPGRDRLNRKQFPCCYYVGSMGPSTVGRCRELISRPTPRPWNKIITPDQNGRDLLPRETATRDGLCRGPQDDAIARRAGHSNEGGLGLFQRIDRARLDRERPEMAAGKAGAEFP